MSIHILTNIFKHLLQRPLKSLLVLLISIPTLLILLLDVVDLIFANLPPAKEESFPRLACLLSSILNPLLKGQCVISDPKLIAPAPLPEMVIYLLLTLLLLMVIFYFAVNWSLLKVIRLRKEAELARQQAEIEKQKLQEAAKKGEKFILGPSFNRKWNPYKAEFEITDTETPAVMSAIHLSRHTLIVAPTRSGKTFNLIRPIITVCHAAKYASIFFDPKGNDFDPALFDINFSMQESEKATSIRLCLINPDLEPTKAANKLAEALIAANKDNPFFSDAARQGLVAFLIGHHVVYSEYPELFQVLEYTGDEDKRGQLIAEVDEISKKDGTTEKEIALQRRAQEALNLLKVAENRTKSKSDVMGSLYNALLPITSGQFRSYVTTNPNQGITVSKMLENKLVVRIAFTADEGDIGKALGKIIIQQFTDTVLSPRVDKSYLKLIVIDEAHNYVCEALKIGVAQAAGNNAGYMMAFQSLKQIEDEAARSIIFGNCKNKVIIAGAEFFDADTFSKDFGEEELAKISKSNTQSNSASSSNSRGDSQSQSGGSAGLFSFMNTDTAGKQSTSKSNSLSQSESKSQSSGESISHQRRPIWLTRELSTIPRYHAVCVLDDGSSKATPEPHLVRFLKPDERKLVEPTAYKMRDMNLPTRLLAATPIPTKALKTKATETQEDEESGEEASNTAKKPTVEKHKVAKSGKPAGKKPKSAMAEIQIEGEE